MNMKDRVFSSVIWKFLERIIAQGTTLIVSLIIARILSPDDYSIVAIATIYFTFANVIISGGFNTALIQKETPDLKDYSTVFCFSLIVSLMCYLLLFIFAPVIAKLYCRESLTLLIRIMGISLPIYAIKSVVCAYISKQMQFRLFFWATLGGTLVSGAVGITMALQGYGAWSLVTQQITNTAMDTIILFALTKFKISVYISLERLKELFSYGWKILASSLLGTVYTELSPLIIGIKFSPIDLSYYSKGKEFPEYLSTASTGTLSAVLFPVLSHYQKDYALVLKYTRLFIRLASFIAFPAMLGLYAVAPNFICVFLTDKWLDASYYIRIYCIACMFDVVAIGNCETIKAIGRSDIYLKMEIAKKVSYFSIIGIFVAISPSPQFLAISAISCTIVQVTVNSIPNVKLLGYKVKDQITDMLPSLLTASIMCAVVTAIGKLHMNRVVLLCLQVLLGVIVYIGENIVIKNPALLYIQSYVKEKFLKDREK